MTRKNKKFQLMVLSLLIIGLVGACSPVISPQINPQVSVKEEPNLSEDWFKTEAIPSAGKLEVKGTVINGETWTCFSPVSSKALAVENNELRRKLELMNTRMSILYKRYFHKDHPTWKLPDTTK